jgi:hypothetical protein
MARYLKSFKYAALRGCTFRTVLCPIPRTISERPLHVECHHINTQKNSGFTLIEMMLVAVTHERFAVKPAGGPPAYGTIKIAVNGEMIQ